VPTLQDTAQDLMKLDGAIAFAFVNHTNGLMLASATSVPYDIELAAAVATEFVRAKLRAVEQMGRGGAVEDILVTLQDELHLTLVCDHPRLQGVFGYLALDRSRGNLALARRTLRSLGGSVEL
jgi:predicted regulator of Ras-like GTPase activity (Roadblock/LC7/MglB family)